MNNTTSPLTTPYTERLRWVDYAKGIGIFLVVLGHTLRSLKENGIIADDSMFVLIDAWIYSFHMPLFFFLAGMFLFRSASKPTGRFLADKLGTIAYPYIVWSLIQGSLQAGMSNYTTHEASFSDLWRIIYQPQMQFWFLYVLLLVMIVYAVLRKARITAGLILLLFTGVYLFRNYLVPAETWGVYAQSTEYAIWIALGAYVGKFDLNDLTRSVHLSNLIVIGLSGLTIVTLVTGYRLDMILETVFEMVIAGKTVKVLTALSGIIAILAVSMIMDMVRTARFIEQCGRLSLEIYVAHTLCSSAIRIGLQKGLNLNEPWLHLSVGTVAGVAGPIVLVWLSGRVGFPYLFTLRKHTGGSLKPVNNDQMSSAATEMKNEPA